MALLILADHFGLSGVLATITAGLVMGTSKRPSPSPSVARKRSRRSGNTRPLWELVGVPADGMHEAHQFCALWLPAAVAIVVVMVGRRCDLSLLPALCASSLRVSEASLVLFWGGLRGLCAALALGLPPRFRGRKLIAIAFCGGGVLGVRAGDDYYAAAAKAGELPRHAQL